MPITAQRKYDYLVLFIIALVLSGCATPAPSTNGSHPCQSISANASDDLSAYSLYINSSGNLYDIDKNPVPDPNVYLGKIFENYNQVVNADNRIQMTVFIHGGLNTSKKVSDRVESLWKPMLADCKYPVFISWRSGFPSNYLDHLLFLRRGEYSSTGEPGSFFDGMSSFIKGPMTSPFVLMEDTLRAVSRIPASTYHILVDQNITAQNIADNYLSSNEDEVSPDVNNFDSIQLHINPTREDQGLTFEDVWSIGNPMKLFTAPYVDSLGSGAWNSMLRRTDLVLSRDKTISTSQTNAVDLTNDPFRQDCKITINEYQTAVSEFFRQWQCRYPSKAIDIIGHSMGSIISNKIIAKYPEIKFSRIVYMAAACPLKDIAEVVSPYLNYHPDSLFYNLSLETKRDQFENSSYVDVVPRGSLLWWLDNTIADVNSFQDRTAGYWPNIYKAAPFIFPEKIQHQVHLTKFGMGIDSPQTHGSFGDFPFWQERFWTGNHD